MNVLIVAVDRVRERYLRDGCALYVERLAPYMRVTIEEVRKAGGSDAPVREALQLVARLRPDDRVWALDPQGVSFSSEALADKIAAVERSGTARLALLIGGPDGLGAPALERADLRWSLSPLTFLHEMARLIALEQLYRAAKIRRGEPYHR